MMMGHCGVGGWAHWVWVAEAFVFWALVITAVVLGVRHLVAFGGAGAAQAEGAREEGLLAER